MERLKLLSSNGGMLHVYRSTVGEMSSLETDGEKVGPSWLDDEAKAVIPGNHFIVAVESQFVAVFMNCQLLERLNENIAQFLASIFIIYDNVLHSSSL